jgi:hypothetical protein
MVFFRFLFQVSKIIGAASEADWSSEAVLKLAQAITGAIASRTCTLNYSTFHDAPLYPPTRRNWPRPSQRTCQRLF